MAFTDGLDHLFRRPGRSKGAALPLPTTAVRSESAPEGSLLATGTDERQPNFRDAWKRVFDVAGSLLALALLAPLFPVVAILIKVDSKGPVFFRQRRVGKSGRHFLIWKFRTMSVMDDGEVIVQAQRRDVRLTRVGRYLRMLNIDEIPQFLNVLTGEMSIVGPRPHAIAHDAEFAMRNNQYQRRMAVKPGITGWAQVNGLRGPVASDDALMKRIEHDLYYVEHQSLLLDLRILFLTSLPKAFRNAH